MKKFFTSLLITSMVFCLLSCGDLSQGKIYRLDQTAKFDGFKLKVSDVDYKSDQSNSVIKLRANYIFVAVEFEVENMSNEPLSISSAQFIPYANGQKITQSKDAKAEFGQYNSLDVEIMPGDDFEGVYAVEVKKETQKIEVHFNSDYTNGLDQKAVFKVRVPNT